MHVCRGKTEPIAKFLQYHHNHVMTPPGNLVSSRSPLSFFLSHGTQNLRVWHVLLLGRGSKVSSCCLFGKAREASREVCDIVGFNYKGFSHNAHADDLKEGHVSSKLVRIALKFLISERQWEDLLRTVSNPTVRNQSRSIASSTLLRSSKWNGKEDQFQDIAK